MPAANQQYASPTEFYRDLVTPIDPTSKFSFLNYLKAQARLDQFFCSSMFYPTRREFEDYFRWVAGQIGEVIFGVEVNCVDYDASRNLFVVDAGTHGRCATKHIVFGCGARPRSRVLAPRERGRLHCHQLREQKWRLKRDKAAEEEIEQQQRGRCRCACDGLPQVAIDNGFLQNHLTPGPISRIWASSDCG